MRAVTASAFAAAVLLSAFVFPAAALAPIPLTQCDDGG
jgi:hypothetical protein